MATERNITMKQFNGIDYDTLYPKTIASQVDGVYNKEETISDTTKALYGLSSAAVPDDAFKKMPNKVNETSDTINPVGTIQTTVRTDLDDNWLLCDGSSFSPTEYPDLANVLSSETLTTKNLLNNTPVQNIIYANNMWVAATGTAGTMQICYTSNPATSWTNKTIGNGYFHRFRYVNGYYIMAVYTAAEYPYTVSIYYTQDVTGTWNKKDIYSGASQTGGACDIVYFKNEYCLFLKDTTGICVCYHASDLNGTWTATVVPRGSSTANYSMGYNISAATDGNVLGVLGTSNNSSANAVCFAYATDISGEWTSQIFTSSTSNYYAYPELVYGNGYFVCFGKTSVRAPYYLWIRYTPVNNINFTDVTVSTSSYTNNGVSGIYDDNAFNIIACSANNSLRYGTVSATNPAGPWIETNMLTFSADPGYSCLAKSDAYVVFGGYASNVGKAYTIQKQYLLPTITSDKSYVYIKAKKDSET